MTDVLYIIGSVAGTLLAISPYIIAKIKDVAIAGQNATYLLSVIQNVLDTLNVAGITLRMIKNGTVTDAQKLKLADAVLALAVLLHYDDTIDAEIKVKESTVDTVSGVVETGATIVNNISK